MSTATLVKPTNGVVTKRIAWADMHDLPSNPILVSRIERIERDGGYKPQFVGVPEVALNDNGAFPDLAPEAMVLIDGHHRKELAKRAGKGHEDVICKIHRGLDRAGVEERFLAANDYRMHHVNELFVHRVAAGEKKACWMNQIIETAGFHVVPHNHYVKGAIRGVNAVEWVFDGCRSKATAKVHPQTLTKTLEGLRTMYGTDKDVTRSNLVKGLGLFHKHYGEAIDIDRLHKNLPGKYPRVASLLDQASMFQEALGHQVPQAVAYTIRLAYNGPRRSKRDLPEWR